MSDVLKRSSSSKFTTFDTLAVEMKTCVSNNLFWRSEWWDILFVILTWALHLTSQIKGGNIGITRSRNRGLDAWKWWREIEDWGEWVSEWRRHWKIWLYRIKERERKMGCFYFLSFLFKWFVLSFSFVVCEMWRERESESHW